MRNHKGLVSAALISLVAVLGGCKRNSDGDSTGSRDSGRSSSSAKQDVVPPAAPSGLTASAAGKHAAILDWNDAAPSDGVVAYRVYRSGSLVASTSVSSCSDAGLDAGVTYDWRVTAVDSSGNESASSSPASATMAWGAVEPNFGMAWSCVALAAVSVDNTDVTWFWGYVGTDTATPAMTGFPPGIVAGGQVLSAAEAADAMASAVAGSADLASQEYDRDFTGTDISTLGTLVPGIYRFAGDAAFTGGTLTLDAGGDPAAVWVFQVGGDLAVGGAPKIVLLNGASQAHVYWQVSGSASIAPASFLMGMILAGSSIDFGTGSGLVGRAISLGGSVTTDCATLYLVPTPQVNLGGAGNCGVLAQSSVSNAGTLTRVNGDLGVATATPPTGPFLVSGELKLGSEASIPMGDATSAWYATNFGWYDYAHGPAVVDGEVLPSGVYDLSGSATVSGTIHLDARNDPYAVWVFLVPADLQFLPGTTVLLENGASAANVFWRVSGSTSIGSASRIAGCILSQGAVGAEATAEGLGTWISLGSGVTCDANAVSKP